MDSGEESTRQNRGIAGPSTGGVLSVATPEYKGMDRQTGWGLGPPFLVLPPIGLCPPKATTLRILDKESFGRFRMDTKPCTVQDRFAL